MTKKKAQITIFIIIAIIILTGIVAFIFLKDKIKITPIIPEEIRPIYNSLMTCFGEKIYESIYEIGQFGGYNSPPNNSLDIGIPVYLDNKTKDIPSLDYMELQISELIKENIKECIVNFTGFNIVSGKSEVITSIFENKIKIQIEYPLTILKGESSYQLKNFPEINIPIRFDLMYNVALEIIKMQEEDPKSLCLSCILELGEKYNLGINALEYEKGTFIYSISEFQEINNQTYEFVFAVKNE